MELGREAVVEARLGRNDPRADEREAGAREADRLVRVAVAEREHVEVLERVERVRDLVCAIDDAVARVDLEGLAVLPGEAAPREDVEDLLVAPVLVRRRRPPARGDLDAAHADGSAARRLAQKRPGPLQVAERARTLPSLVPVRDSHRLDYTARATAAATAATTIVSRSGARSRIATTAAARPTSLASKT